MGRKLKLKQDIKRFEKTSKLCKGEILHLGASNIFHDYDLHNYLKERHKDIHSVDLGKADFIQNLNDSIWKIPGKYDTVLAAEIIEHVENPSQFLRNCFKLLKKGGRLVVSTPNATSLIYLRNPRWCVDYKGNYDEDTGHLHAFTTGMLKHLFKKAGIKDIKLEYHNDYFFNPIAHFVCSFIPRLQGDIIIWGERP